MSTIRHFFIGLVAVVIASFVSFTAGTRHGANTKAPNQNNPAAAESTLGSGKTLSSAGTLRSNGPGGVVARLSELLEDGELTPSSQIEIYQLIRSVPDSQMAQFAKTALNGLRPDVTPTALSSILAYWAERDGVEAMEFANSVQSDSPRTTQSARQAVLSVWSRSDPKGALEWYSRQEDRSPQDGMHVIGMFRGLAKDDFQHALDSFESLPNTQDQANAVVGLASADLDQGQREQVIEKIEGVQDEHVRRTGYSELMKGWAEEDPMKAKAFYEKNLAETDQHGLMANSVGMAWIKKEPEAAADWLWEVTPDEQKSRVVSTVLNSWGQREPEAAGKWLETFELGPEADFAISTFSNSISSQNPKMGMRWATRITNRNRRMQAVSTAYAQWIAVDRQEADRFMLKESGLAEGEAYRVMNAFRVMPEANPEPGQRNP